MTKYLTYTFAAFLATSFAALASPDTDAIKARETAAWQAYKDKDAEAFKKVVDHDIVGVYSSGINDMAAELADMKKSEIKSFTISDFKAHSDEKNVIVTSYKVKVEGTVDGKDVSGTQNAGSVWKLEKGQWMAIFHTNMPAAGAAAAAATAASAEDSSEPDAQKKEEN